MAVGEAHEMSSPTLALWRRSAYEHGRAALRAHSVWGLALSGDCA